MQKQMLINKSNGETTNMLQSFLIFLHGKSYMNAAKDQGIDWVSVYCIIWNKNSTLVTRNLEILFFNFSSILKILIHSYHLITVKSIMKKAINTNNQKIGDILQN